MREQLGTMVRYDDAGRWAAGEEEASGGGAAWQATADGRGRPREAEEMAPGRSTELAELGSALARGRQRQDGGRGDWTARWRRHAVAGVGGVAAADGAEGRRGRQRGTAPGRGLDVGLEPISSMARGGMQMVLGSGRARAKLGWTPGSGGTGAGEHKLVPAADHDGRARRAR